MDVSNLVCLIQNNNFAIKVGMNGIPCSGCKTKYQIILFVKQIYDGVTVKWFTVMLCNFEVNSTVIRFEPKSRQMNLKL